MGVEEVTATDARAALEAVATLSARVRRSVPVSVYALVRVRMARLLGIDDRWRSHGSDPRTDRVADWPSSALFSATDRACLAMAEQFVVDVAGVTDEQRRELAARLGASADLLVSALYAIDAELRLRSVSRQLLGVDVLASVPPHPTLSHPSRPVADALDAMSRTVAGLTALDPLTTEVVRLRGARINSCRLCRSLRHVAALEAGGSEDLYDRIDDYEAGGLDERHLAALRLTDAVLLRPDDLPEGLIDQVRSTFTVAESLEIVLDVLRNARNKVAVARGVDGEGAGDGLTVYDTPDGGFAVVSAGPGFVAPGGRF